MKKIIAAASIIIALGTISCHNNRTTNPADDSLSSGTNSTGLKDNNVDNPRAMMGGDTTYQQGAVLLANNACKTCHAIDKKIVGPSYNMIADKYENTPAYQDELAYKIVKGGYGRWGSVSMPPQHATIPEARQMAGYILSLKTK